MSPQQACKLIIQSILCRTQEGDAEWLDTDEWDYQEADRDWSRTAPNDEAKESTSDLVDNSTAAIIDEQTEENFDWRAELLQMEQENRRNEVRYCTLTSSTLSHSGLCCF